MLNTRQERFCQEYLVDDNATQAAIRAGYSERTAGAVGCRLLTNAKVEQKIADLQAKRADRLEITADKVLRELARIAFGSIEGVVKIGADGRVKITATDDMTVDQRRTIKSISETANGIKIKFNDKLRALELVGKHIGLFIDRVEITEPSLASKLTDEELQDIIYDE